MILYRGLGKPEYAEEAVRTGHLWVRGDGNFGAGLYTTSSLQSAAYYSQFYLDLDESWKHSVVRIEIDDSHLLDGTLHDLVMMTEGRSVEPCGFNNYPDLSDNVRSMGYQAVMIRMGRLGDECLIIDQSCIMNVSLVSVESLNGLKVREFVTA